MELIDVFELCERSRHSLTSTQIIFGRLGLTSSAELYLPASTRPAAAGWWAPMSVGQFVSI